MDLKEKIKKIAESKITDPSQFLVDVILTARQGPKKLMVIIDGDKGITIDDCTQLSRQLSEVLDETNLIDDQYLLEVSTPGLDQPLKLKRQYYKNIGREIKVHLKDKQILKGNLTEVTEENIRIEEEIKEGKKKEIKSREIAFEEIEKSLIMVSFKK